MQHGEPFSQQEMQESLGDLYKGKEDGGKKINFEQFKQILLCLNWNQKLNFYFPIKGIIFKTRQQMTDVIAPAFSMGKE